MKYSSIKLNPLLEDCDKNEIDLPLDHFQECILSFLLDETLSWLVHEKKWLNTNYILQLSINVVVRVLSR